MEYVRLAPGLPPSSRLGFGCGSVMGRVGRADSLRAIAAAVDAGITHFDVARLYGYGEAETLLGDALRGRRRDNVVIASKFGLAPSRAATVLRRLKPLAQKLVAAVPALRPMLRAAAGGTATTPSGNGGGESGRFSAEAADRSLTDSLRALQTDYLDILFLHDAAPADLTAELLDFLNSQRAAGRIRALGVASGIDTIAELVRAGAAGPSNLVYQFGNSVCVRTAERLPPCDGRYIAHSPFYGAARLLSLRNAQPALFRLPGGKAIDPAQIHALMLAYALSVRSVGVVLCSMLDPRHLRANLATAERPGFTAEEVVAFAAMVRRTEGAAG